MRERCPKRAASFIGPDADRTPSTFRSGLHVTFHALGAIPPPIGNNSSRRSLHSFSRTGRRVFWTETGVDCPLAKEGARVRQVAAVALAALVSAGCLSVGVAAIPKPTPTPERLGKPFQDPLLITGTVRVGPPGSGDRTGGTLIGNSGAGLTSPAPLADSGPIEGMGRMGTLTALASAAPLGSVAQYRVMAPPKGPTGLYVEVVDLDTGERVGFGRLRDDDTYMVHVPVADYVRGLAVQVTGLAEGKVTGFLAAPVRVPANFGDVLRVDITPGSTAVLFAKALLAGVRGELVVDKGFRGFASEGLAYLVRTDDAGILARAIENLDGAPDMLEFPSSTKAMEAIVILAEKLARATGKHGLESGSTFMDIAAADRAVLKEVGRVEDDGIRATAVIDEGTTDLPKELVARQKKELEKLLDEQDKELGGVTVLPTPTPEPTPPSGPQPGTSPSVGPSTAPTATPLYTVSITPATVSINALPASGSPDPRFVTSATLVATVTGPGEPQGVTWSSSDTSLVQVSTFGVITAAPGARKGVAIVTATSIDDPRAWATCSVEVTVSAGLEVEVK